MKTLSKFMNVDIFGKCGDLKCGKGRLESCYREMNETYKFYLSFENSLCEVGVRKDILIVFKFIVFKNNRNSGETELVCSFTDLMKLRSFRITSQKSSSTF